MSDLIVIDNTTGEIVGLPDNTVEIASIPIRVTWDVRLSNPTFLCDAGESDELSGTLLQATHLYACWSDIVGQPSCLGTGKNCPNHPETSDNGIGLVLETDQFGLAYLSCFGLMKNFAQGLVRRAHKHEGDFMTSGVKVISTKHGPMRIPGLK